MMRGRAFYPGGDAVWKEDGERGLALPLPDKPLMFVGQNFDDEDDPVQFNARLFHKIAAPRSNADSGSSNS
jgi:hypothetical protein